MGFIRRLRKVVGWEIHDEESAENAARLLRKTCMRENIINTPLVLHSDNGCLPIDNNRAERTIKPFVIGRKNWMFSNSAKGAKASANLDNLVETTKANGIEPYDYINRLLTDISS